MDKDFLVDSHCHLDLIEQKGYSCAQIIENALNSGVRILQTINTKITDFNQIYQYTKLYPQVFASVGIHPNEVENQPEISASDLIKICNQHDKVTAIGETGLDYYYQSGSPIKQQESLLKHIEAARKTGLPLVIHNRNSDSDMINILESEMKKGAFKALLHCFSSSKELAFKALELDIYISISGIVTFKSASSLQEIVKLLPLNRILIETDSPYLAPVPYRGQTNQPAFVRQIAEFIADLKQIKQQELFTQTTCNFLELFSKIKWKEV